jgi:hypothetical protein
MRAGMVINEEDALCQNIEVVHPDELIRRKMIFFQNHQSNKSKTGNGVSNPGNGCADCEGIVNRVWLH